MERIIKSIMENSVKVKSMLIVAAILNFTSAFAQNGQSITGKLIDENTGEPVSFAYLSLYRETDQKLLMGTLSDENGQFKIDNPLSGSYNILISYLGYKPLTISVAALENMITDIGIISLQETVISTGEVNVVADKLKARQEGNRTTFFMTEKMVNVSGSGMDILKFIPGVQVDFMQNISLEGSQNIMIFVDGKERDSNFLSQLPPDQIEKVEIINVPTSEYDGGTTGAINVILKKDRDSGFNGQFYGEVPLTGSVIYISPKVSLNYGRKKLNFYASYSGQLINLDLHESLYREAWSGSDTSEYFSNQYVRQKNQEHRFSYGIDYFPGEKDMINFYAFCNPYSRELDGNADLSVRGSIADGWQTKREDTDRNTGTFYSLFYKHLFGESGGEMSVDLSSYYLRAKNITEYINTGTTGNITSLVNKSEPRQYFNTLKADYSIPAGDRLKLSTGFKFKFQSLKDNVSEEFRYNESILAFYGMLVYKQPKIEFTAGLRTEKSSSESAGDFRNSDIYLLPNIAVRYKLNTRKNIQLSYNRSVRRPNISELNPYPSFNDPWTVSRGNPLVRAEVTDEVNLEYSMQFKSNYVSSRLFYKGTAGVINSLTLINDSGLFENEVNNSGTIARFGAEVSGSIKIGKLSVSPYLKLYQLNSYVNRLAGEYKVEDRRGFGFESGLSGILSFKKDLALSFVFQYNSPKNWIQGNSFSDPLYFVSVDKIFRKKIKVGAGSGLTLTKHFIYNGSESTGGNFYSRYKGIARINAVPVWIKLGYQFNSGKVRARINREKEEIDNPSRKGF